MKENATAKFDETVEMVHTRQMHSMTLAAGDDPQNRPTESQRASARSGEAAPRDRSEDDLNSAEACKGKKVRVAVFAKEERHDEALAAGAHLVGERDLVQVLISRWEGSERLAEN